MSLEYSLIPNRLVPSTYYARPLVKSVGTDEVVNAIHLRNPTVSPGTIELVLNSLTESVSSYLSDGNSVNLSGFVRFVPSLPGVVSSPEDVVTASDLVVNAVVPNPFRDRIREGVQLTKTIIPEKIPIISFVSGDRNGFDSVVKVTGNNLRFNEQNGMQGIVYIATISRDTVIPTAYATVTDRQIVCDMPLLKTESSGNEYIVQLNIKYTPNGVLRTGRYSYCKRITREVTFLDTLTGGPSFPILVSGANESEPYLTGFIDSITVADPIPAPSKSQFNFTIKVTPSSNGTPGSEDYLRCELILISSTGEETIVGTTDVDAVSTSGVASITCTIPDSENQATLTAISIPISNPAKLFDVINTYYEGSMYEPVELSYEQTV